MTENTGEQLAEEPQSERGPLGSRDSGSDEPSGGPADRPAGTVDDGEDSTVDPQEPQHGGPDLQTGG